MHDYGGKFNRQLHLREDIKKDTGAAANARREKMNKRSLYYRGSEEPVFGLAIKAAQKPSTRECLSGAKGKKLKGKGR